MWLLLLEQEDRSFEDHTKDSLDPACLTCYSNRSLCIFFHTSLNECNTSPAPIPPWTWAGTSVCHWGHTSGVCWNGYELSLQLIIFWWAGLYNVSRCTVSAGPVQYQGTFVSTGSAQSKSSSPVNRPSSMSPSSSLVLPISKLWKDRHSLPLPPLPKPSRPSAPPPLALSGPLLLQWFHPVSRIRLGLPSC